MGDFFWGGCQQTGQKPSLFQFAKGRGRDGSVGAIRGISLLSVPRKVHGKVITERVQQLIEEKINEEQGGFKREGDVCIKTFSSGQV